MENSGNPETRRFGRYEIDSELGRGAMGIVYKARDPQIDRWVALKTIPLHAQPSEMGEQFRHRFLNEAQAVGRLIHPGIVAVFDVGEDEEHHDPYIVFEYVAGEALNKVLSREKILPLARALQLVEELAEALDYAHQQGVVHRDIKPGNILLTPEGHAKIADFGIAKIDLSHTTLPGKVLGTPAYMAPEQLCDGKTDGRSDLFSLGVILYAMVTSRSPFRGDNSSAVCHKVATLNPPPPSAVNFELPRELDAVVARALAKKPGKRYQSGAEFAQAIHGLRARFAPTLVPVSPEKVSPEKVSPGKVLAGPPEKAAPKKPAAALQGRPATGLAYAAKVVRSAVLQAPLKDLALGFATITMLLIVGVQGHLLFRAHSEEAAAAETPRVHPGGAAAGATRNAGASAANPKPAAGAAANSSAPNSSTSAKAALQTASAKTPAGGSASPTSAAGEQVIVASSALNLAVQHQFKNATLYLWVDDQLMLKRVLHGGTQKRLVVFNGVRGVDSETIQVLAGKHTLRLRALTADQSVDLSKTIAADFIGGGEKALRVTFDKHNSAMRLEWR
ncbi:MAG TPA: protein kinase [Candidatus Sulfotelmatobacter sp.]|nr:protein kinase [Candidatus Sulfotelmatobacter sp.]